MPDREFFKVIASKKGFMLCYKNITVCGSVHEKEYYTTTDIEMNRANAVIETIMTKPQSLMALTCEEIDKRLNQPSC